MESQIKFIELITNLKHTSRKGWVYRGVENHESVASHMYSMAMLTFLIKKDFNLDRLKCMQLALVHDLAECITGDITPLDNVNVEEKHKMEREALKSICQLLDHDVGNELYSLYTEYEAKSTPEAKFVKDLDRLDMIFTANYYEKRDKQPNTLQEFFNCTEGKFEHDFIKAIVKKITDERSEIPSQNN